MILKIEFSFESNVRKKELDSIEMKFLDKEQHGRSCGPYGYRAMQDICILIRKIPSGSTVHIQREQKPGKCKSINQNVRTPRPILSHKSFLEKNLTLFFLIILSVQSYL